VQMINVDLIFRFAEGRCHGNQMMFRNEGKLILHALFARLPDVRTVLFSPLGKLAGRAIYFTDVFSLFFIFFNGRLSSQRS